MKSVNFSKFITGEMTEGYPPFREYICMRCNNTVRICRPCDRGHIYCGPCAPIASNERKKKARKKYRNSVAGKLKEQKYQSARLQKRALSKNAA